MFYSYFGYPLSLLVLTFNQKHVNYKSDFKPLITVIIAVHNEDKQIAYKLDNTLELLYPEGLLQIIVASDGSTDRTNDIVKCYEKHGIKLIETERKGKENAQKEAIGISKGEIFVFTDAGIRVDSHGLQMIVRNFADENIGCVSSEDMLLNERGVTSGEGVYVKYEIWLRRLESRASC